MSAESAGSCLADARRRKKLSQRALALRAGTSQAAISRVEKGLESPTLERLEQLLLVLGERLIVSSEATAPQPQADRLDPAARLREAASWNLAATRLELAGAAARRAGHPATRRS